MGNEIKKAKPKKSDDSLKYPDYFDYIDIIAERESVATELERISDNYYKFCPLKTEPLQNIFEDLKKLERDLIDKKESRRRRNDH